MSDSEVLSPALTSLGASRPRPRRNHKPSTPSSLSPTSLPSLFNDAQLTAFFPTLSPTDTAEPHDAPSYPPSVVNSNGSEYNGYPSVPEEAEAHDEGFTAPAVGVKEAREEEGWKSEVKREEQKEGDKEGKIVVENGREDEARIEEEEEEEWNDRAMKEGKERDDWEKKEEEEHNDVRTMMDSKEDGDDDARRTEQNAAGFPSVDDEGDVFEALQDTTCADTPIGSATLTRACVNSSLTFPLPPSPTQPAQVPEWRRPSHPACLTPDSIPDSMPDYMPDSSYTTDDAAPTEILSSPQSAAYEDDDLHIRFVFPPKISRLGSIYSHLGLGQSSGGSSSSDSDSDTCGTPPKEVSLSTESHKYDEKGDVLDEKHVWSRECDHGEEGTGGAASVASVNSQISSRSNLSSRKSCHQSKKAPPAKPPRLRASMRMSNNTEERRSREDPVRYIKVDDDKGLSPKRSISMNDILESNLEAMDETSSRFSQSPEEKVMGLTQPPTNPQGEKKDQVGKISNSKYKDAAKIVSSFISKKPPIIPFLHRKEASRSKNQSTRKMKKDMQPSPSPAPAPSSSPAPSPSPAPAEAQEQDDVASKVSNPPNKPPRKDLDTLSTGSLDKAQTTCDAHGALLHFYCVKCRVVVCRDCTVVAHSHTEHHKVLDTLDSLAMLRSEAVAMLRHYTILETMHASLTDIYRRFTLLNRDVDIAAIRKRLDEGKYLAEVVEEAEQMVTTWTNLHKIQECVRQWEARQNEWGDLVFLASRCALLTDMRIPIDTVLLRMGSWVMPTPWIQLSHLLQPYLRPSTPSPASSSRVRDDHVTSSGRQKALDVPSSLRVPRRRNASPYGGGTSTGGTDQPFPYNARQMVLSNLVPYIILNPDIRYFVHVGGPRDVDLTLVVVPVDDHAHEYLRIRRNNAIVSPEVLRQANYRPPTDAITLVEQQMTCGSCKTRITASSMPIGSSSAPVMVKVSFSDVKIVSEGNGLPAATGGVKRGNVIVDQSSNGRPTLTVVVRDIGDFPALRLGQVTWGMDGLTCLVGAEDTKRTESSGFRARIKATVKREEEAVYDVMFGMDL